MKLYLEKVGCRYGEIFSEIPGVSYNAIYIEIAVSACIGTVLIGLLANLPLAQAAILSFGIYGS